MIPCPHDIDCIDAEVWYGNEHWVRIAEYDGVILFISRKSEEPWSFQIDEVFTILNALAKEDWNEPAPVQAR